MNVVTTKLYAFAFSSALAAAAGVLFAFRDTYVTFERYSVFASVNAVVLTVVGGIGWIIGGVIGGLTAPGGPSQAFFEQWWSVEGIFPAIAAFILLPVVIFHSDGMAHDFARLGVFIRGKISSSLSQFFRKDVAACAEAMSYEAAEAARSHRVEPQRIEFNEVTVRFGVVTAVDRLSMHLEPGEVLGLIGPNGAGKTTLIDAATGYVPIASGSIVLNGKDISARSAASRASMGICRSFQSLELFEDLTVLENICLVSDERRWWSPVADLVRPSRPTPSPAARAAIEEFGLGDVLDRKPDELHYAQRRLVAIARAVAASPSVLLLDEPAAGLDDISSRELGHLIRRLATDWGMAVLMIEHDVQMVFATCDRVVALNFGAEVAQGTSEEVRNDDAVIASYLGAPASTGDRQPGATARPLDHAAEPMVEFAPDR